MTFVRGCAAVLSVLLVGSATRAEQAGQKQDLPADLGVSAVGTCKPGSNV
jgi:hypothetical protein